jgi:hypothetical protein
VRRARTTHRERVMLSSMFSSFPTGCHRAPLSFFFFVFFFCSVSERCAPSLLRKDGSSGSSSSAGTIMPPPCPVKCPTTPSTIWIEVALLDQEKNDPVYADHPVIDNERTSTSTFTLSVSTNVQARSSQWNRTEKHSSCASRATETTKSTCEEEQKKNSCFKTSSPCFCTQSQMYTLHREEEESGGETNGSKSNSLTREQESVHVI